MLAQRHTTIIDLGRSRIRALEARRAGGGYIVTHTWAQDLPTEIKRTDAQQTGAWIRQELRDSGFKSGAATVSLAREDVVVKRLTLPTTDIRELPEMTLLAMQRELTFDTSKAVIDFQFLNSDGVNSTVLAVAVPTETLDLARQTIRAAGFKIRCISLRAFGSVALIADDLHSEQGPTSGTLTIDVTSSGIEFCVVKQGSLQFSRAAHLNESSTLDEVADNVLTETTRTWTSFGIIDEGHPVTSVAVFAPDKIRSRIVADVAITVDAPVREPEANLRIEVQSNEMEELWPAAGLLLQHRSSQRLIDLEHPTKAVDQVILRRRRFGLVAALIMVTVCAVWTILSMNLGGLQANFDDLSKQRSALYKEYTRHFRDQYQLSHLEFWESAQIDVLGHLLYTQQLTPPSTTFVLDRWMGLLEFSGVEYDRTTQKWLAPQSIKIVVDGEAPERVAADAYRQSLVENEVYSVSSSGADAEGGTRLGHAFTYRLTSSTASPQETQVDEPEPET